MWWVGWYNDIFDEIEFLKYIRGFFAQENSNHLLFLKMRLQEAYALLDLETDADEDQVKQAYRKKALEWFVK
jgi:DnaJ-class molecular chaperone